MCSVAQCIEGDDSNTVVAALTPALAASAHGEDTQQAIFGSQVSLPVLAEEQGESLVESSTADLAECGLSLASPRHQGNDDEANDDELGLTAPVPFVGDLPVRDSSLSPSPSRSPSPLLQPIPESGRASHFIQASSGTRSMLASMVSQVDRRDTSEVLQLSSMLLGLRVSEGEDHKPRRR